MSTVTRHTRVAAWSRVALAVVGTAAASAGAQSITSLGTLPGGTESQGLAVSANGQFVAGNVDPFGPTNGRAFRWTRNGGMQDIGSLPGGPEANAVWGLAISGNGQAVAGINFSAQSARAYVWRRSTGVQSLGVLPGASPMGGSEAYGLNFDGTVACGVSDSPDGWQAFRWTQEGGMQGLGGLAPGLPSFAYAISADGSTIVGNASTGMADSAFKWTAEGGMQALPDPFKSGFSFATAVTADGSVIVGLAGNEAVRWDAAGGHGLGVLPGGTFSVAYSISGNGRVIGGYADGEGAPFGEAFLWTQELGLVALDTFLAGHGVDLTGWTLEVTAGISADGTTLVGVGQYNGVMTGWVVTLPQRLLSEPGRTTTAPDDARRGEARKAAVPAIPNQVHPNRHYLFTGY